VGPSSALARLQAARTTHCTRSGSTRAPRESAHAWRFMRSSSDVWKCVPSRTDGVRLTLPCVTTCATLISCRLQCASTASACFRRSLSGFPYTRRPARLRHELQAPRASAAGRQGAMDAAAARRGPPAALIVQNSPQHAAGPKHAALTRMGGTPSAAAISQVPSRRALDLAHSVPARRQQRGPRRGKYDTRDRSAPKRTPGALQLSARSVSFKP
jgi:hypothetical protein